MTGARLLELSAKSTAEYADKLAERLSIVLDGIASVMSPCKRVAIRINGLDDATTAKTLGELEMGAV